MRNTTFLAIVLAVFGFSACSSQSPGKRTGGGGVAAQCADGLDNDGDTLVDHPLDPGCDSESDDSETDPDPVAQCADGDDNDEDGKIDLLDPGCDSAADDDETDPVTRSACDDGADNDGDGLIDFPADLGCAGPGDDNETDPPPPNQFTLANQCWGLRAAGDGNKFVVRTANGYAATGARDAAELFYLKPTELGSYLIYGEDRAMVAASGSGITAAAAPSDNSDWIVTNPAAGAFNIKLRFSDNRQLATDAGGQLVVAAAPATFAFVPATGCSVYPEMPTGIATTFKSNPVGSPVIGFAEVHAHMAMGSDMSLGGPRPADDPRGPSAGGVMYGHAAHRFGAPHALADCSGMHGEDGVLSPEWLILDSNAAGLPGDFENAQHFTQGWPTFESWPERNSLLHQQMYYKWVERAYKAGLRTMVIHGTNIEALCDVANKTGNDKDPDLGDTDCTDMGVGMKQVAYLTDIQNYIDAQEGGPGKGWFRIVKDPAEARGVIADGKMAVIPGLEFSNIFRCNVTYSPEEAGGTGEPGSANDIGTSACEKEDIDREIDEVWEAGVRAVFPYHDVDSALGGTGIFDSFALNLVGFYGTRGWWRTYDCEDGGEGPKFFYDAGEYMYSEDFPESFGNDPITAELMNATGGILPFYRTGVRQCNARDVTPLGLYAIKKIMQKGFTLDIDHAEIRSKQIMLDLVKDFDDPYPMISGHGGHGGISNEQIKQMIRQGGIVYPNSKNGREFKAFLDKLKTQWTESGTTRPLAIGYGADQNGLAGQPGPRGAGSTAVEYPFTLFSGPGWGPQYAAAGIAPVTVSKLEITEADCAGCTDGRTWVMDEEGMAHYGMWADVVEEIRIEGGQEATDAFYRSAEAYLQMWEQTLRASAEAREKLTP